MADTLAWQHSLATLRLINRDISNAVGHTHQALSLLDERNLSTNDEADKLREVLKILAEAYRNVEMLTLGYLITEVETRVQETLEPISGSV